MLHISLTFRSIIEKHKKGKNDIIIHGQFANFLFFPKRDVTIPDDDKCRPRNFHQSKIPTWKTGQSENCGHEMSSSTMNDLTSERCHPQWLDIALYSYSCRVTAVYTLFALHTIPTLSPSSLYVPKTWVQLSRSRYRLFGSVVVDVFVYPWSP